MTTLIQHLREYDGFPVAAGEKAPGFCRHCRQYTIEEPLTAPTVQQDKLARAMEWYESGAEDYQEFQALMKELLDEPAAEPVAFPDNFEMARALRQEAMYGKPETTTVQDEPVAWASPSVIPLREGTNNHPCVLTDTKCGANTVPLYAAPPQRKPLTEEEIFQLVKDCTNYHTSYFDGRGNVTETIFDRVAFARAIEAAQGITGESA